MKQKRAIISGATRGIGKAVAIALADQGYDLALAARDLAQLENFKAVLKERTSGEIMTRSVDFASKFETSNFAQAVLHSWGGAEVIVNNVGIYSMGIIDREEEGTLEKMLQLNLQSAYYLTLPFLKGMRQQKNGHVFNICSAVCKTPRVNAPAYTISKQALKAFNDVLREEMRPYGVKVTAVIPGSVNTSSWEGIEAPKEDFVQPEDVAALIMQSLSLSRGALMEEIVINPLDKNY